MPAKHHRARGAGYRQAAITVRGRIRADLE
jgi:hypothetical protein